MKKIVILFIVIFTILATSGCSGAEQEPTAEESVAEKTSAPETTQPSPTEAPLPTPTIDPRFDSDFASFELQELITIKSSEGGFGHMDYDGQTLVIGEPYKSDYGDGTGTIYIFEREETTFNLTHQIFASNANMSNLFGSRVLVQGDVIYATALYDDRIAEKSGAVYVYQRSSDGWEQGQVITPSDATFFQGFGSNIAVEGNRMIISAIYENAGAVETGAIYYFERNLEGVWVEKQKITPEDVLRLGHFGNSILLSGDTLFASAQFNQNGEDTYTSALYVFDLVDGQWIQSQKLTGDDPQHEDNFDVFGNGLALSGENLIITNFLEDYGSKNSGALYWYKRSADGWDFHQKFLPENLIPGLSFGLSPTFVGNTLLVGYEEWILDRDTDPGLIYVLSLEGDEIAEFDTIPAPKAADGWFFGGGFIVKHGVLFSSLDGGVLAYTDGWGMDVDTSKMELLDFQAAFANDPSLLGDPVFVDGPYVVDSVPKGGCEVTTPPAGEYDPFYEKYCDMNGIPILASAQVADETLEQVWWLISNISAAHPELIEKMVNLRLSYGIIGKNEDISQLPEFYQYEDGSRLRGIGAGGSTGEAITVSAEENIMCLSNDTYFGVDMTIHEFSHTIMLTANLIDPTFNLRVSEAYNNALENGLWGGTYAAANEREYWAEGSQIFFGANDSGGVYSQVNNRETLAEYDPGLYALLLEIYPFNDWQFECPSP
ncbi:MAG: FG-GAP repeat protein [Chloroflexota bacterium]